MKTSSILRKIFLVLLFIGIFIFGSFLLLNYAVDRYHQSRIEKHIPILEELKLKNSSQEQIQDALGTPTFLLNSADALELSRGYFPQDETAKKSIKYPKVMVYLKGDIVYFIYLNDESKMVDFSIVRN